MTYQPGVPTGTVPLNQDYLNLQGNFGQLNTQWLVDHVPLTSTSGSPPNGYHLSIHMVPQASITNTPGYSQWYTQTVNDGINTDQILYYNTGTGNRTTQMTRNFVPVAATSGYTFLPGGFVLQWGTATFTGSFSITYTIPLSNPAYSIQLTQFNNGSSSIREYGQVFATTAEGFTGRAIEEGGGLSPNLRTFYWVSLGK